MSLLDDPTRALVRLAAAIATGQADVIAGRCRTAVEVGVPPIWVDELLLQSVLMVGYPRALGAAGVWREVAAAPAVWLESGSSFGDYAVWQTRGEATCRTVYGSRYEKLRSNVRRLHPALDAWMVTEGYGRTLARPGLDLACRELAVIAQVAVLGAERQLHSHLRGALNVGVERDTIDAMLDLILPDLDPPAAELARRLWAGIRP